VSPQRRADLLLLSITVVWGSTFVITKALLEDNSPHFYTAVRFILSTLLMGAVIFPRLGSISRPTLVAGLVLGALLYVGFILQTVGLEYTTASKAAFFTGLLTVFTPLVHFAGQRMFGLKQSPLRVGNILAVMLAAAGLYLLTSPTGGAFNRGDALTLGCALCFAVYIVYLDYVTFLPDKLQLAFVQFAVCAVLGSLGTVAAGEEIRVGFTPGYVTALLYLVIFATVITMGIQIRYQGDTTPTRAAVIFALEPVVAALFAYGVRDEVIGVAGAVGGALILTGVAFSEFAEQLPLLRTRLAGPVPATEEIGQTGND
jgi:drug/metabolite transporter (DMT)-like permease